MKFLLIAAAFPSPADSGGKLRSLGFLKHMAEMGEVHFVSLCDRTPTESEMAFVAQYCRTVHCVRNPRGTLIKARDLLRSIITRTPYLVLANRCRELSATCARVVEEHDIDVIQVEELFMTANLEWERQRAPIILDAHNAEASVQRRLCAIARNPLERKFYAVQTAATARFERSVSGAVDAVFCVSPEDLEYFAPLARRVVYVPNGIDAVQAEPETARSQTVLFTGTLQYPPNRDALEWLLRSIWPRVSAEVPTATLQIIARNPPEDLRRIGNHSVTFLDDIDSIDPYYASAKIMAVPLRAGGGTRFKVLHAFAHGLAVVSTQLGAEGLSVQDGVHLTLRDDTDTFAEAIISLLRDPAQRERLTDSARALVEREYLWRDIFQTCRFAYEGLTA